MSNKKSEQLGMNSSTAQARLLRDILFSLVVETGKNVCHHCGGEITRDDFSIEHIEPWLDSDDPKGVFFDLKNISFSHLRCNVAAARRPTAKHGTPSKYVSGCRCKDCTDSASKYNKELRESKRE